MQHFSTKQRAALNGYGLSLEGNLTASSADKENETLLSRIALVIKWMKDKSFNEPCMQEEINLTNEDKDNVLAMFVMALIQGETLESKMIRPGTMRGYLAAFLRLFHLRKITDPTKDVVVSNAWKAVELFEKWQKLPKRREPLSDSMCEFLIDLGLADPNQDGLDAVIADWLIIGRYLAFRLSEFAQDTQSRVEVHSKEKGGDGSPKAFTFDDVHLFASESSRRKMSAKATAAGTLDDLAEVVEFTWRFQKNSDNGQAIKLTRDDQHKKWCPVRAAIRIKQRAIRHKQTGAHQPLGFYVVGGKLKYLTGIALSKSFRTAATLAEGITDPDLLSRFSPHSIRVTAANLLHRAGKSPLYIQLRCRWKSQTFMMYLRNTISLAKQHVAAATNATAQTLRNMNLNTGNIPVEVDDLNLDHLDIANA